MNKTELAKLIAEKAAMKINESEQLLNAFTESITDELKKKGKVTLSGFGSFSVSQRSERSGVNPKTGEAIHIKAKNMPVFKSGKLLKDKIK